MTASSPASRSRRRQREIRSQLAGFLFVVPVLIPFILFRIWPAINGFLLAFQDYKMNKPVKWVGFDQFRKLIDTPLFYTSLKVSLTYAAIAVPLVVIGALCLALLINKAIAGLTIYRAIYFLPYVTSFVMVAMIWSWVYQKEGGILNAILGAFGVEPHGWLISKTTVIPSLAVMGAWKSVGYSMLILLSGLKSVPEEVTEASQVDGATATQTFFRVTLPLLRPILFFVVVIETIGALQVFDPMFIMTGGGPVRASYSLTYYLYDQSFKFGNYSYAAAIGIVVFLITFSVNMVQRVMFGERNR